MYNMLGLAKCSSGAEQVHYRRRHNGEVGAGEIAGAMQHSAGAGQARRAGAVEAQAQ